MFIIHINVVNKVSGYYYQQVATSRLMKGKGKGKQVFIIVFILLVLIIVKS